MADTRNNIPSVVERVRPIAAGAPVVAAHFLDDTAIFVLGEKALLFVGKAGEETRVAVHDGAILTVAADATRIVTAGDDGKVVATDASGNSSTIATDAKRRWIDRVALAPDGSLAWSAGKTVCVCPKRGGERTLDVVSTVGGLAFLPKGFRLAIAHYNGVSLWFPNAQSAPETLAWKGSHVGVTASADSRFLVTAMQEPTLHGWRLADRKDMRMSGYAAKVRSMSWSAGGRFLATGGAEQLILWPFDSKDGPMGKTPTILAPHQSRVATVACHPKQPVVAAGFEDGLLLLVRIDDGAEIVVKRPGPAPVSALVWDAAGAFLAFGAEDGEAGILPL